MQVSVRSERASPCLPDSRAATRADGMSAACVTASGFAGVGWRCSAAMAALVPSTKATAMTRAMEPAT
ncbi:hypothetical protein VR46_37550 [Streptomyces sp. NRRL S-444]|nr:hypothetical protein VR46_37550 [Streptomyces sp. NRRL S-444]